MPFRYDEIGNRLKAFRLGSGMSADEVASRIGISRTALYRFERGDLVKLETLDKLSELLNVSITTLLGVGIEYIPSAVSYFERMRQIEATAEHITMLAGPISFLLATDRFGDVLEKSIAKGVPAGSPNRERSLADLKTLIALLRQRHEQYALRRPSIVKILSVSEIDRFLSGDFSEAELPENIVREHRQVAFSEIEHMATIMEQEPMGVQIGIVKETLPPTGFYILRSSNQATLVVSPFRLAPPSNVHIGVAMITSAPEAVELHQNIVKNVWSSALKGVSGANYLRKILKQRQSRTR